MSSIAIDDLREALVFSFKVDRGRREFTLVTDVPWCGGADGRRFAKTTFRGVTKCHREYSDYRGSKAFREAYRIQDDSGTAVLSHVEVVEGKRFVCRVGDLGRIAFTFESMSVETRLGRQVAGNEYCDAATGEQFDCLEPFGPDVPETSEAR